MNYLRIYNKVLALKKEWFCKCHFFNPVKAAAFTLAPYTQIGNGQKHKEIFLNSATL